MRLFKTKHLGDKIFGYTMLFYLIVVCGITFWLVAETYRSASQGVLRELKLYETTFSQPLTENLWALDMAKVSSLIQGIVQIPEIIGIRVIDPNTGQFLARRGWVPHPKDLLPRYYQEDETITATAETKSIDDIIDYRFRLVHQFGDQKETLGEVTLFSDKGVIIERIKYRIVLIVAGAGAQVLFLWIFFSWISRRFLSRPLLELKDMVESFDLKKPEATVPVMKIKGDDELAILSGAFAAMQKNLVESVLSLEQKQLELRHLNENLEEIVQERTAELKKASEALEQSPVSVVVTDKDGTIEYVNPIFCEVTGYSADEAIGQNPRVLKSGELPETHYKKLWDTILAGKIWRGEFQNKRKNGEDFWESASISPIKNEKGEITHFVAVKEDITEQKKIRESLRESESRFRGYFEHSPIGIAITTPDRGWIAANEHVQEMLGYRLAELRQMDWAQITHPEDIPDNLKLSAQMQTGEIDQYTLDKRFIRKNGEIVYTTMSVSCVRDENGAIRNTLASIVDITERKRAEEILKDREARTRAIVDFAADGIITINEQRIVEEFNTAAERIFDYKAAEVLGQNVKMLMPEPHHSRHDQYVKNYLDTGEARILKGGRELLGRRKDGSTIPIYLAVSEVKLKDRRIFTGIVRDISKLKQAEEAIRERAVQLRTIFRNSPIGITYIGKDGTVLDCNDRHAELMGSTREKIVGMNLREEIENEDLRAAALGALAGEQTVFEAEYTSVKGGRTLMVRSIFNPTEPGTSPTEVINTTEDITDRKQMEQEIVTAKEKAEEANVELFEAKERISLAISAAKMGIWDWDMQTQQTVWDAGMFDIYGIPSKESTTYQDWRERVLPEDIARAEAALKRAVEKKDQSEVEFRINRPDGDIRHIYAVERVILNAEGEVRRMVGVNLDITDRKEMEAQIIQARQAAEEATHAKSDFLANMSHEIRTPMNAVIGMTHLAMKTELTPKQRDYLNKIQSSANSLLGIINDILDFSKIEAGKLDMETVEFNLDDVLDNLANLVTIKAQEKEDLEVLFATARDVPRFLVGDPLRLGQVLINLANNAVKFTNSGEIVVSTELLTQSEAGLKVMFSVKDTGIGLTEEQIGKLFQAFSQADTSTTRKFGGTGLGLTISKRLVGMMGGEIWVESEPGQGTTFSFSANFGLGKEKVKERLVPSSDLRGMKALVVDDSATSRSILQDILESFTFEVTLAASGEEGLEEIQKADSDQPYELVLMDWKMPGLDGLEASEYIKRQQNLSKIPAIILVTAYGREELMQRAEQIGLEGFLIKPVSPSVLFDTIMQAFGEGVPKTIRISEIKEESKDWKDLQGAQVLLVEDNEINQQVAQEILQGAGLIVTVANDGQEGVKAAMQNPYDAILMDIQMPVMDGYAAARKIREWQEVGSGNLEVGSGNAEGGGPREEGERVGRWEEEKLKAQSSKLKGKESQIDTPSVLSPQSSSLPIIAMTAHAMSGDEQKSLDAGMNDHVTKPIDPEQLFGTLLKWIKPVAERTAAPGGPPALDRPSATDKRVPEEDELPDSLPGFDLDSGLARLMGNKRLYRKLLVDFGADFSQIADKIRETLEAEDFKQAHSLVHNLKGMAGNLAAGQLQAAAEKLEKLVKREQLEPPSDEQLHHQLIVLEKAVKQALEAVHLLGVPVEEKSIEPTTEWTAQIPVERVKEITDRINAAAEMGDVIQIKSIADELMTESEAAKSFCDELVRLAEDFDFDGIQRILLDLDS